MTPNGAWTDTRIENPFGEDMNDLPKGFRQELAEKYLVSPLVVADLDARGRVGQRRIIVVAGVFDVENERESNLHGFS